MQGGKGGGREEAVGRSESGRLTGRQVEGREAIRKVGREAGKEAERQARK